MRKISSPGGDVYINDAVSIINLERSKSYGILKKRKEDNSALLRAGSYLCFSANSSRDAHYGGLSADFALHFLERGRTALSCGRRHKNPQAIAGKQAAVSFACYGGRVRIYHIRA
jgi:hypothetical protein